jgi:hypothetical protein
MHRERARFRRPSPGARDIATGFDGFPVAGRKRSGEEAHPMG